MKLACDGAAALCLLVLGPLFGGCTRAGPPSVPSASSGAQNSTATGQPTTAEEFAPSHGVGFCSGDDWCWISTETTGVTLWDVWSHPDAAYAVGDAGMLLKLVGNTWRQVRLDTSLDLHGIDGSAPDNIYVVGGPGLTTPPGAEGLGVILHFDGKRWRAVASEHASGNRWRDVWVSEEGAVFVAGDYGSVLSFDGKAWKLHSTGTDEVLNAVAGTSPRNVMAVGNRGAVQLFDGKRWGRWERDAPINALDSWVTFFAAGETPDGRVVAVGNNGAVYLKDGSEHSWLSNEPGTEVGVRDVTLHQGQLVALDSEVYSLSGTQWTRTFFGGSRMRGIAGDATGRLLAVGGFGGIWEQAAKEEPWRKYGKPQLPDWTSCSGMLTDESGALHLTTSTEDLWKHTAKGWERLGRDEWPSAMASSSSGPFVARPQREPAQNAFEDIGRLSRFSTDHRGGLFAVGTKGRQGGFLAHFDGSKWSEVELPTRSPLSSVWCQQEDECWAVGNDGTLLQYAGAEWQLESLDFRQELRGVHGDGDDTVFVVGMNGFVLQRINDKWTRHELPTQSNLNDVLVLAPNNVYGTTTDGEVVHFDGTKWSRQKVGTTAWLASIVVSPDGRTLSVCGADGVLQKRL